MIEQKIELKNQNKIKIQMENNLTALIVETKKAMGYGEERRTCEFCKHYREEANEFEDRSFVSFCHYSNLVSFEVKKHASCSKFENKNNGK